jgi:hypothetical protein
MTHGKQVPVRKKNEAIVITEQLDDDVGFLHAEWEHWVTPKYLQKSEVLLS